MSQTGRILKLLKDRGQWGAYNYELSKIALKYTNRISELRKEGNNILTERISQGTFRYILIGENNE